MTKEEIIKIAKGLITDFKCDSDTMVDFCNSIITLLEQDPSEPVHKKGKWIKQYAAFVNYDNQIVTECHCTNCSGISYFRSMNGELVGAKYCPNCKAEMENEEDA